MNSLAATITNIEVADGLSLVDLDLGNNIIVQSIIIETPDSADYLKLGNQLNILFKETEVTLMQYDNSLHISTANTIQSRIISVETGKLLSSVVVDIGVGKITAIVVSHAFRKMNTRIGDTVYAVIKTNEIMLSA